MRLVFIFALSLALAGCATKGGWPCFSWEKNTDQKLEQWAKDHPPQ